MHLLVRVLVVVIRLLLLLLVVLFVLLLLLVVLELDVQDVVNRDQHRVDQQVYQSYSWLDAD